MTSGLAVSQTKKVSGTSSVLERLSFKNSKRGAIIYGLLAGFMISLQGLAFAAAYTSELAREKFATAIASNPAVALLYGEIRNIETPSGYMVYRSVPFLALIGALWGLFATTRLLRGQEEDGNLEIVLAGRSSLTGAMLRTLKGLAASWLVAFGICAVSLIALGSSSTINVSVSASLFLALAILAPAALFMTVGALTSQLAATRRQAVSFGLILCIVLFVLRSIGNVVESLHWLKYASPFGWVDKLHPVTGSEGNWFIPFIIAGLLFLLTAMVFSKRRDLGDSIVADKSSAKPRFKLLGGPLGLSFRLSRLSLFGWLFATSAVAGLITALAKTAADALADSDSLTKAVGNLSGAGGALNVAFVSLSGFFTALLLMIVVASGINRLREDELKGYAENFLVTGYSRTSWVVQRISLLLISTTVICLVANLVCLATARFQHITFSASQLVFGGFNYLAPAILMAGVGVLLYGLKPRLSSVVLYAWIAWSFIIEMVGSVVTFKPYMLHTSLLRNISLVPAAQPDWKLFIIVSGIGLIAGVLGLVLFTYRDLQTE